MTLTITVRFRGFRAGTGTGSPPRGTAARPDSPQPDSTRPDSPQPDGTRPDRARHGRRGDGPAAAAGGLAALLPLAGPAALLLAESAGLGLVGRVLLAAAVRSAQRAMAG